MAAKITPPSISPQPMLAAQFSPLHEAGVNAAIASEAVRPLKTIAAKHAKESPMGLIGAPTIFEITSVTRIPHARNRAQIAAMKIIVLPNVRAKFPEKADGAWPRKAGFHRSLKRPSADCRSGSA
jgi:hypothetical protein